MVRVLRFCAYVSLPKSIVSYHSAITTFVCAVSVWFHFSSVTPSCVNTFLGKVEMFDAKISVCRIMTTSLAEWLPKMWAVVSEKFKILMVTNGLTSVFSWCGQGSSSSIPLNCGCYKLFIYAFPRQFARLLLKNITTENYFYSNWCTPFTKIYYYWKLFPL